MADLDRETQDRYEVVIRATDMAGQLGGLSGSTTVTIVVTDVNDNPPRFPQSKSRWRWGWALERVLVPCGWWGGTYKLSQPGHSSCWQGDNTKGLWHAQLLAWLRMCPCLAAQWVPDPCSSAGPGSKHDLHGGRAELALS